MRRDDDDRILDLDQKIGDLEVAPIPVIKVLAMMMTSPESR
jgi:hypothetical protein